MVLVITSLGYPFFNKVFFMNSGSTANFGLAQVIKARWTKVFIKFILRLERQKEPHLVYDEVNDVCKSNFVAHNEDVEKR